MANTLVKPTNVPSGSGVSVPVEPELSDAANIRTAFENFYGTTDTAGVRGYVNYILGSPTFAGSPVVTGTLTINGSSLTTPTTFTLASAATTLGIGATSGTLTLSNPTIIGSQTTQNIFNTVATTLNIGGAATSLNLGATSGTLTLNNPTVVGSQTTQNLFNTVATTLNIGGAATTIGIGASTGTTTVKNNLAVNGQIFGKYSSITPSAGTTLDFTTSKYIQSTPGGDGTYNATVPGQGTEATLIIVSTSTSRTITFGTGFKSNGNLITGTVSGKYFVVRFVSNGTSLIEVGRTTAM
jgi:hypothetical protein